MSVPAAQPLGAVTDVFSMSSAVAAPVASERRARWRLVVICVVTAVGGAAVYYLSSGPTQGRAWEWTIALLLAFMAGGICRFQAASRLAWSAIWLGLMSAFTGGVLAAHPHLAPFDVTSPSLVDGLRLANYPLAACGVLVLMFRADRGIAKRALLESAIAVGAGSLLIWVLVIDPLIERNLQSGPAFFVAMLYPLGDVLLLSVLVVLIVHVTDRPGSLVLIGLALGGNLAADIAFSYENLHGGYEPGGLIDVGWLLCFAALALAPSWPIARAPSVVGDDGRLSPGRLAFLASGALLAPGIAIAQTANGRRPDVEVIVAAFGLFTLVLVRTVVFNRDLDTSRAAVARLADELSDTNQDLESARADQRRLLHRIHQAIEDERTRIAADIHDRPLQHLAGIGYRLERVNMLLARGDTDGASTLCDLAAGELAAQLGELRVLMTDIRPPILDERGLTGALEDRAAQLREDHPHLDVVVSGNGERVHREMETVLYRVAQEALQNVVRHADATAVSVSVAADDGQITLTISDDGQGFVHSSLSDLLSSGRFGLAGMSERVELVGGSMCIDSRRPGGTTIRFDLPANPADSTPELLLVAAR